MYAIKFTEEQLSFLFNNLEADIEREAQGHTWFQMMSNLNWDEYEQRFRTDRPILLNEEQRDDFYRDMVCDSEEILRQMGLDVRYHSINDSSWSNSKWCLELISDVLERIRNAEKF